MKNKNNKTNDVNYMKNAFTEADIKLVLGGKRQAEENCCARCDNAGRDTMRIPVK